MLRRLTTRLLACLLAITSGFAVPVSALAHGHEHHHEAAAGAVHHGDDHHSSREAAHELTRSQPANLGGLELEKLPSEDAGSHPHPCLDRARSNRVECLTFALLAQTVAVPIAQVVERAPAPPVDARIRPRALDHAPPPPSRAPPTLPG